MRTPSDIEDAIKKWKEHMYCREMGHDLYYTDPYGRDADLKHLRELNLELAQAQQVEAQP